MKICAATGNAGKLRELRRILEAQGHEVVSQKELGITIEPDETGTTFEENALIKAETICKASGLPTIADDFGPLRGRAGGCPRRVQRPLLRPPRRRRGQQRQAAGEYAGYSGRTARRKICGRCLLYPAHRPAPDLPGRVPGKVAFARLAGDYGFGYDPLFIPDECGVGKAEKRPNTEGRSYAQLTPDEKDAISHRGVALAKLEKELPEFLK